MCDLDFQDRVTKFWSIFFLQQQTIFCRCSSRTKLWGENTASCFLSGSHHINYFVGLSVLYVIQHNLDIRLLLVVEDTTVYLAVSQIGLVKPRQKSNERVTYWGGIALYVCNESWYQIMHQYSFICEEEPFCFLTCTLEQALWQHCIIGYHRVWMALLCYWTIIYYLEALICRRY